MAVQVAGDTRLRPFEAMRAVRKLIATPGDTSQVFVIFRAMRGRSGQRSFRRFVESPVGQAVLRERRDLFPILTDREGLERLPPGSLGRAYLDFVEAEICRRKDWWRHPRTGTMTPSPPMLSCFAGACANCTTSTTP